MRRAEGVVFALGALGEAGQAAALAQGADPVAPAGKDLVRVGLMPHIPDQPIPWGIEDMVQRDRQLDDPQAGPEVPAGDGYSVDRLGAQFIGQLSQRPFGEAAQGFRACDAYPKEAVGWVMIRTFSHIGSGRHSPKHWKSR